MIKGHTKIELFNAATGAREKVTEDDNLVTDALGYLVNLEAAGNRELDDYVFPVAEKALGGLMLFDNEIEESTENIYFPGEAHLIGYADRASGTEARRGSYNSLESGRTDSGYVSVWDFGTSQANGTIRSAALTHVIAGANPICNYIRSMASVGNGHSSDDTGWYPVRMDGDYVYMAKYVEDSHEIRLSRMRLPLKKHRVADYAGSGPDTVEEVASWDATVAEYTYTSSKETKTGYRYTTAAQLVDGGDGYLYAVGYGYSNGNSSGDGVFYMYRVKYSDDSWEKEDWQEITAADAALKSYGTGTVRVSHGYLYWISYDSKSVYIINLSNTADIRAVQVIEDGSRDYIQNLHYKPMENGGVFLTVYHYYTNDDGYEYRNGILYEDGTYFIHEFAGSYYRSDYGTWSDYHGVLADGLAVAGYSTGTYITIGWLANYLGTINNLSSSVEKNASQTMKITYTLTDAEET